MRDENAMSKSPTVNRERFVQAIIKAIDDDEYLYEQLPGDGRDDYILQLVREIIKRAATEFTD